MQGERGESSVQRPPSLQSRLSNTLALALMGTLGVGLLGWYYAHNLGSRSTGRQAAQSAAKEKANGDVNLGQEKWSTEDLGLPTRRVDLPVRGNGWLLGHFLLTPTPGKSVPHERLVVAVAIADQVGAALAFDHPTPASRA